MAEGGSPSTSKAEYGNHDNGAAIETTKNSESNQGDLKEKATNSTDGIQKRPLNKATFLMQGTKESKKSDEKHLTESMGAQTKNSSKEKNNQQSLVKSSEENAELKEQVTKSTGAIPKRPLNKATAFTQGEKESTKTDETHSPETVRARAKIFSKEESNQQSLVKSSKENDMKEMKKYRSESLDKAPEGPGWVKLSESLYIYNKQALKQRGRLYKGKQRIGSKWRDVAVKLTSHEEENLSEINFILKLEQHQNIIDIYEAGVTNDVIPQMYVVMELCLLSMRDYIDKNKRQFIDFEAMFLYTKKVFEAVAFMHGKNIIHGDLKLENILLTKNNEIRVADFGLSRELDEGRSVASVSCPGIGSEGYISPELYAINAKASRHSDTFALGIVTYELFTNGKHPFGSDRLRWRTNIIDNANRDLSGIPRFDQPYALKRDQLTSLLTLALEHKPRSRPDVESLLKFPFFQDCDDVQSHTVIHNPIISGVNIAIGNSKLITGGRNNSDTLVLPQTFFSGKVDLEDTQEEGRYTSNREIKFAEEKIKRAELIGALERMLGTADFNEASDIIEKLEKLRGYEKFEDLLRLAECEIHLKRGKGEDSIRRLKEFISKSRSYSTDYLYFKAEECKNNSQWIRMMILCKIIHDILEYKKSGSSYQLKIIKLLACKFHDAIKGIIDTQNIWYAEIVEKYAMQYQIDLLSEIENVDSDDEKAIVDAKSVCMLFISQSAIYLSKFDVSIDFATLGIATYESLLKSDPTEYKLYGWLLKILGQAHLNMKEYQKSEKAFLKALNVFQKCSDWDCEGEKEKTIEELKMNLLSLRSTITN